MQHSLQQRQQYAELGLARTPKAAWLLAQCHCEPALRDDCVDDDLLQRQLAMTPIAVLEIDSSSQRALQQMGLTALGALRDLPTAALGKRFGTAFTDYLKKIDGATPDPQVFFIPALRFQHGLAFVDGIAQRQMLLFPMKRLLQSLSDYLNVRQLHCHTLHWQLFDAHQVQAEFSVELSVELGRTQNHWHSLLELSRLKLDQVPPITPVFSINLFCEDFFEATPAAQQLFPDANDQREAAAGLIDRLQARLGKEALQRIAVEESYWPELAWRFENSVPANRRSAVLFATTNHQEMICTAKLPEGRVPGMRRVTRRTFSEKESIPIGSEASSMTPTVAANNTADRLVTVQSTKPLWLLPEPQLLPQRDNQPCWPTPLTLLRGPERIDNHWWQEAASERDYYIARNQRGVICWIFYERETQRWFLHGLFS